MKLKSKSEKTTEKQIMQMNWVEIKIRNNYRETTKEKQIMEMKRQQMEDEIE